MRLRGASRLAASLSTARLGGRLSAWTAHPARFVTPGASGYAAERLLRVRTEPAVSPGERGRPWMEARTTIMSRRTRSPTPRSERMELGARLPGGALGIGRCRRTSWPVAPTRSGRQRWRCRSSVPSVGDAGARPCGQRAPWWGGPSVKRLAFRRKHCGLSGLSGLGLGASSLSQSWKRSRGAATEPEHHDVAVAETWWSVQLATPQIFAIPRFFRGRKPSR